MVWNETFREKNAKILFALRQLFRENEKSEKCKNEAKFCVAVFCLFNEFAQKKEFFKFHIFSQKFFIFCSAKISHFFTNQIEAKFYGKSEKFLVFREQTKCGVKGEIFFCKPLLGTNWSGPRIHGKDWLTYRPVVYAVLSLVVNLIYTTTRDTNVVIWT